MGDRALVDGNSGFGTEGIGGGAVSVFCDFDGTLTTTDIGFDLFDTFGKQEPLHSMLVSGELPVREYWRRIADTLREPMTRDVLDTYLLGILPDPGTGRLLELVRNVGVPFTLLSDGMSLYIERWLELHGFEAPTIFCNRAELDGEGRITVGFPWSSEECTCRSAVCKRNLVLDRTQPEGRIIYIGDGMSDFCPAELADIVFAKGALAAYCNENGLPHHSFRTLTEVLPILERHLKAKRIRSRKRAEDARKRAWREG